MKCFVVCACVLTAVWGSFMGDACRIHAGDPVARDIWVKISPNTIVLGSDKGDRVTVHTDIPLVVVDRSSIALNGVGPVLIKADNRGNLVAKFDQGAIEAIVAPPEATLNLSGITLDGEAFYGFDSVRVIDDPSSKALRRAGTIRAGLEPRRTTVRSPR